MKCEGLGHDPQYGKKTYNSLWTWFFPVFCPWYWNIKAKCLSILFSYRRLIHSTNIPTYYKMQPIIEVNLHTYNLQLKKKS